MRLFNSLVKNQLKISESNQFNIKFFMFSTIQPSLNSNLTAISSKVYKLTVQPLLPGYGYTLGNSLRRILLSSIPGFAVTKVKINNITHEYQVIEGVMEDALEVVLNLKTIRAKILTSDEKVVINLAKSGNGDVFARDFKTEGKVQIINEDLYICTLNKDADLDIEIEISRGTGYLSVEKLNLGDNPNPQYIIVDALFSPVTNVGLEVEQVRVGEMINFDRLELTFEIDQTMEAKEIIKYALDLNIELLQKINSSFAAGLENVSLAQSLVEEKDNQNTPINLPKKILSILEKNNILTNNDLLKKNEKLDEINGLDEKMTKQIKEYLVNLK